MARLDDNLVASGIPDRGSGLVGWDTTDGLDAALADEYEWWGVTPDGLPLERLTHVEAVG